MVVDRHFLRNHSPVDRLGSSTAFPYRRVRSRVRVVRMEASGANSDARRGILSSSSNIGSNARRHGVQLSAANLIRSLLSTFLEYSGILRTRSSHSEADSLINSKFQPRVDDGGHHQLLLVAPVKFQLGLLVLASRSMIELGLYCHHQLLEH